ncbi:MAG: excinuclease ABC subunit UvrC [Rhodospirillales bacterium]|nr:excinuclease ABC subunit UvrC [Rhodospirillales bacterium]MSP81064.1 excinuclease ABC subunit UvrC [Rhodospirillales bacterium]
MTLEPEGADLIRAELSRLPAKPGIYRMLNGQGDVLYVGKAKDLRKRVTAYARPERQSLRIRRMIAETRGLEFVTAHTEAEALLLEANLIKRFRPRYNILLRDDKSFPSILIARDHPFPQVLKHRGARARKGDYFGPFASVWAVNEALSVMQRAFLLRSCPDSVFANRARPCLLHQIKRCSAPCVGRVTEKDYARQVADARAFLAGRSREIQAQLSGQMQAASDRAEFEQAAELRDRLRALAQVQSKERVHLAGVTEADVIAAHQAGGHTCIEVFFFRAGANWGDRAYFPSHGREDEAPEVLEAFLGQFYAAHPPPKLILLSHRLPHRALVAAALEIRAGRKVALQTPARGEKRATVEHALANAQGALTRRLAENASQQRLLEALTETFALDAVPMRIEVYDNSHIQGRDAVGAMIVAGPEGFMKGAYRKFTIKSEDMAPGDDYAMMRDVLARRFSRALKEDPDRASGQWPDLVLLDGGAGQLSAASQALADLGLGDIALAAIAKGPERTSGRARIFLPGREPFRLEARDPVLYFIERLRDEAHRFAIGVHRAKRGRGMARSALDEIPGIGNRRKRALLHHFGAAEAVSRAGRAELERVPGVSRAIAHKIYDWFHPEG